MRNARVGRVTGDPYLMNKAHREKQGSQGCIFVSYATPDFEIARYVVSQLQQAGCHVWFDREQIQPGENWKMRCERPSKSVAVSF